jgi:hypothetical protein
VLTVSLDNTLWFAAMVAEAVVIGLLIYRRIWRTLPVFCVYCAWGLLSDTGGYAAQGLFAGRASHSYLIIYLVASVLDSVLQFSVLVELAWSVLRPMRTSLPRGALVVVGVLIVVVGAVIWPFTGIHGLASLPPQARNIVHVQQVASILRILFFLALAGCSQLLSIGWRDRELQVATGLGFYSMVSLAVQFLHTHQVYGPLYIRLDQIVAASFVCSLLYWVFSFAQQEAARRAFTPEMQNLLLAVAGTARTARIALTDSAAAKNRKREE